VGVYVGNCGESLVEIHLYASVRGSWQNQEQLIIKGQTFNPHSSLILLSFRETNDILEMVSSTQHQCNIQVLIL
jgi:hypothetical protein